MARYNADVDAEVEQSDLASICATEIRNSSTYDQSQLSQKRSLTLEYMRGIMPDVQPRPNGSQQTSRDVNDTINWMLPGIMRTFAAASKFVQYKQVKDEDPAWADQATTYTNYSFFVQNDGYQILRNATYDAMAMGNGVVECYWDKEQSKTETLRNQTPEEIADLLADDRVSILSAEQGEPRASDSPLDQPGELPTFNVKVKRILSRGKVCDVSCKPENLFLNTWANTIEDARFVAYLHDDYTRSDLVQMADQYGWDKDDIENLPAGHSEMRNQVGQARRYDLIQTYASPLKSGDQINLYRCFPKADVDDDGIAELLEVWFAGDIGGGKVLSWSVWEDDIPYTDIPCYPIPHRWDAESVSDRTMDVQRVKTVLLRAMLDSTYQSVLPQREVELGSVLNPDILTNPRFGGIIWKKPQSAPIVESKIPYTGDKSLIALQAMDEIITKRTGVSKTMMALDPDALQNQTATANQNMKDAGYSQSELVARDMAQYGWKKYFRKRLKLAIKYHEVACVPVAQPDQVAQGGQPGPKFEEVKPGNWDEEMAVNIDVGLGTGSRDRDMAMMGGVLTGLRGMAQELGAVDPPKAIEFLQPIRRAFIKFLESSGISDPESYIPDITDEEIQQLKQKAAQGPQPDPKIAADLELGKMKIQSEQMSQQNAGQIAQIKAQAETQKAQSAAQVSQIQIAAAQQSQQDQGVIAQLRLQLDQQVADQKNNTALKLKAMEIQGQLEAARIAQNHDQETLVFSKWLDGILGVQEHMQNMELEAQKADNAKAVAAAAPKPNGSVQ